MSRLQEGSFQYTPATLRVTGNMCKCPDAPELDRSVNVCQYTNVRIRWVALPFHLPGIPYKNEYEFKSFHLRFEICAFCTDGVEGFLRPNKERNQGGAAIVYCCTEWGIQYDGDPARGRYVITRILETTFSKPGFLDWATDNETGDASVTLKKLKCKPPDELMENAIINQNVVLASDMPGATLG
jgi:hypothetical protein